MTSGTSRQLLIGKQLLLVNAALEKNAQGKSEGGGGRTHALRALVVRPLAMASRVLEGTEHCSPQNRPPTASRPFLLYQRWLKVVEGRGGVPCEGGCPLQDVPRAQPSCFTNTLFVVTMDVAKPNPNLNSDVSHTCLHARRKTPMMDDA